MSSEDCTARLSLPRDRIVESRMLESDSTNCLGHHVFLNHGLPMLSAGIHVQPHPEDDGEDRRSQFTHSMTISLLAPRPPQRPAWRSGEGKEGLGRVGYETGVDLMLSSGQRQDVGIHSTGPAAGQGKGVRS